MAAKVFEKSAEETAFRAVLKEVYESGKNSVEWSEILYKNLSENHEKDVIRQATSFGPHKDDLEIFLDGMNVRNYGSQGQQRSCALSLKIGEASILKNVSGEQPIALMDDVMSELDENRQKFLMKYLVYSNEATLKLIAKVCIASN